jgi:large repetitive protein
MGLPAHVPRLYLRWGEESCLSGGYPSPIWRVEMAYDYDYKPHKVVAEDDYFKGKEDEKVFGNVLGNDYDTKKHDLDAKVVDGPDYGKVYLDKETGDFKYIPNRDFYGTDTFTYKAFDDYGKYDEAKVKIEIKEVPEVEDKVIAKDDKAHVKEGKKVYVDVSTNDYDTLYHDLDFKFDFSKLKHGKIVDYDKEKGTFTYKAFEDKDKKDEVDIVKYKAYDKYGNYDWAEVKIKIEDNDYGKKDDAKPHYDLMV